MAFIFVLGSLTNEELSELGYCCVLVQRVMGCQGDIQRKAIHTRVDMVAEQFHVVELGLEKKHAATFESWNAIAWIEHEIKSRVKDEAL